MGLIIALRIILLIIKTGVMFTYNTNDNHRWADSRYDIMIIQKSNQINVNNKYGFILNMFGTIDLMLILIIICFPPVFVEL